MSFKRWLELLLFSAVLIAGFLLVYIKYFSGGERVLTVSFLDIGQGDAIFIDSPTGNQMLIDGGSDRSVLRRLGENMSVFDREIDVVLSTHPDSDHLGGLSYVLERFKVDSIFYSGVSGDSSAYTAFEKARLASGSTQYITQRNQIIDLGGGAYVRVIFPDRVLSNISDTNTASAVVEVVYGDIEFLLTGDSPKAIESYTITLEGEALQSEVLKAGHHGSRTSTSAAFVDIVDPDYVVISAGKDNQYGHPHREVLDILAQHNVQVLSTYKEGDVIFKTNGEKLWRE